jgi:SAM-dependent methyltransferase
VTTPPPAEPYARSAHPVTRRDAGQPETVRANRTWWDGEAQHYYAEHGAFLGDTDLTWGPEGLRESEAHLLGDVAGKEVLEIGCGGAQCSRWVAAHRAARVVASDVSAGMLERARLIDDGLDDPRLQVPLVQCDGAALPFADASFDLVFTSYGVVPFVADSAGVMRETARVLRRGGRFVFSTTHPIRWALPDDPGEYGLRVTQSYFDRTPYVEQDASGQATYVEHHRTLGDRVREVAAAGLRLVDLVEPEWPDGHRDAWAGWSPLRGRLIPGTAIFVTEKR